MTNNDNGEGVKERIKRRLLEATDEESLRGIRRQLKDEGEKSGSVDACVHELRKQGHLQFDKSKSTSTKLMPKDLVPTMQSFIEDVHVPRPIDGQDGYWDGYEMGARRARQDLIFSLLAMRELQSQSTSQVVSLAKELRPQGNAAEVAQMAAQQTLGTVMPQILDMVKQSAVASSPNPMLTMFSQSMQPLLQQLMGNLMVAFTPRPGQPPPGQPAQPGQQPGGQPVPGTQPPTQQPGFQQPGQQVTEDEIEGVFND